MNPIEKADPSSSASRAGLAGKTAKERSMEKVAESFESFFINNMLKEMGKAAHEEKLCGGNRDVPLLREGGRLSGEKGRRDKRDGDEISRKEGLKFSAGKAKISK